MALSAMLLLGLAGCSPRVVQPERAASIKTVGVLLLLPTQLVYEKIGITVFNNERASRPVGDAFKSAAMRGAERALATGTSRRVVRLEADTEALARKYHSGSLVMSSATERIQDELANLARQHAVDAILVIAERFDSEQGRRGIQVNFRAGFGDIRYSTLRPEAYATLVDSGGQVLARSFSDRTILPISRPDGQPWSYELGRNIDDPTQDALSARMQDALETVIHDCVQSMGL